MYSVEMSVTQVKTVSIVSSNGRLQIQFRYEGKRLCLSLGLPDNEESRTHAESVKTNIETDIEQGKFDPDKLKSYRVFSATDKLAPNLLKLWESFIAHKEKTCSPNTIRQTYRVYTNHIKKLPTFDINRSGQIVSWCNENLTPDTAHRLITRLSACCNHSIEMGMISVNPFEGKAKKVSPKQKSEAYENIRSFTIKERDQILEAIKTDQFCNKHSAYKHSHYYPLFYFLFATGCRPSEAVALRWTDINNDCSIITFRNAIIETEDGRESRSGLKTQKSRKFPCNKSLQELLLSIKPTYSNLGVVFRAPKDAMYLNPNNLRNRVFYPVLDGLGIERRPLYNTRHTFITLALQNGMNVKDVARICGNSVQVIIDHYWGNKNIHDLNIPEF